MDRPARYLTNDDLAALQATDELVPDDQLVVGQRDRLGGLEPRPNRRVGKITPRLFEEALPGFFWRLLHRRCERGGTLCKGDPILRAPCGKVNLDRPPDVRVGFPPLTPKLCRGFDGSDLSPA